MEFAVAMIAERISVLEQLPGWAAVERDELEILARHALLRTIPAQHVWHYNQIKTEQCWLLLAGAMSLHVCDAEGRKITLQVLNSGQMTGHEAAFNQRPFLHSAQFHEPSIVLQWPLEWLLEQSNLPYTLEQLEKTYRQRHILQRLAQVPLFGSLPPEGRLLLSEKLTTRTFDRDTVVFEQGTPGKSLFLIERGQFIIEKNGQPVATLGEGSFFGEMALVSMAQHNATVRALTPSRCLELPGQTFKALVETNPALAAALRSEIDRRVRHSNRIEDDPAQQQSMQRAVEHGMLRGSHVLARLPALCPPGCRICEEACADRFGQTRLHLNGASIAGWDVTQSCRQCRFAAECVDACPEEAIVWDDGAFRITEACTGCGDCVPACPYDAVTLQTITIQERNGPLWKLWQRLQGQPTQSPHQIAAKCDLCAGHSDKACLSRCPTGALRLIPIEELFPL